jgi:hypothetical protein
MGGRDSSSTKKRKPYQCTGYNDMALWNSGQFKAPAEAGRLRRRYDV